jgi:hypothetical protein
LDASPSEVEDATLIQRGVVASTALVVLAAVFTPQAAASTFSSTAESLVSEVTISGGSTFTFHTTFPSFADASMDSMGLGASGTAMVSNAPGAGLQGASASGVAPGPGVSFGEGMAEAHDFIEVFASSTGPVLEFTFDYGASSSVMAMAGNEAVGHYNFHITGADDETGELLEVDTGGGFVTVPDFEVDKGIMASLGDAGRRRHSVVRLWFREGSVHGCRIWR